MQINCLDHGDEIEITVLLQSDTAGSKLFDINAKDFEQLAISLYKERFQEIYIYKDDQARERQVAASKRLGKVRCKL